MSNGCMASACAFSAPLVSAPSACPSKKTSATWFQRRRRTVSCRASGGRVDDDGLWLPRRDMMLSGLSGVAAGLALYPGVASGADTVTHTAPCTKLDDTTVQCTDPAAGTSPCPPVSTTPIVDFTPETGVKRIRKPVHLLTHVEVAKYKKAVEMMKALPIQHPLSFQSQAAIHEAYCDAHYRLNPTKSNCNFDVHFSRLFAPWHRMYIYFYESALGQLIRDDTFALPYWSWDLPESMVVPAIFKEGSVRNPLYDPNRNPATQDALIDLDYLDHIGETPIPFTDTHSPQYKALVYSNLCTIHTQQQVNLPVKCPDQYLGEMFCGTPGGAGFLETKAHNNLHVWVGKAAPPEGTTCTADIGGVPNHYSGGYACTNDMGFLGAAGRDPLFYSHHANVDRMWYLWSKSGGKPYNDLDWLNASFVFYDDVDNPRKVRIKISDVLDTRNLGYTFDPDTNTNLPWQHNVKLTSLVPHGKDAAPNPSTRRAPPVFPLKMHKGQVVVVPDVPLPAKVPTKDLLVVIDGIMFDPRAANKFDVAINVPADKAFDVGPQYIEFAGAFTAVPSSGDGTLRQGKISLCINALLAEIQAEDAKTLDVVIVPRTKTTIQLKNPPTIQYLN